MHESPRVREERKRGLEAARVRSEPRIGCTRDSSESTWRRLIRRAAAALALAAPNSNLEGQNHSTLSTRVRLDYNRPPLSLLGLETAGGSETARTPVRGVQVLDLRNLRRGDALEDELSDAVTLLHLEVLLAVVEQDDADVAAVVVVHDARAGIDEVLPREPGPRRDARVGVLRATKDRWMSVGAAEKKPKELAKRKLRVRAHLGDGDGEVGLDQLLAAGGYHVVVRGREVVSRGAVAATDGQGGVLAYLLDAE